MLLARRPGSPAAALLVLLAACGGSSVGAGTSPGMGGGGTGGSTISAGSVSSKPGCGNPGGPTGATPIARGDTAGALGPDEQTFVMFGGDTAIPTCTSTLTPKHAGDTWVLDVGCGTWTEIMPASAPSARARHAMTVDAARGRALLFGGRTRAGASGPYTNFADVWAFDFAASEWSQITTTGTGPSARSSSAVAVVGGNLVVFGGDTSTDGLTFVPQNDAFSLDLGSNTWTMLSPSGTPPAARLFHAMAADPVAHRVYVYAGGDANAFVGPFFSDLWALDLDAMSWTDTKAANDGTGRIELGLTATKGSAGTALYAFAGHDDGALGNRNDVLSVQLGGASPTWSTARPGDVINAPSTGQCMFPADFTKEDMASPERRSAFASGARLRRGGHGGRRWRQRLRGAQRRLVVRHVRRASGRRSGRRSSASPASAPAGNHLLGALQLTQRAKVAAAFLPRSTGFTPSGSHVSCAPAALIAGAARPWRHSYVASTGSAHGLRLPGGGLLGRRLLLLHLQTTTVDRPATAPRGDDQGRRVDRPSTSRCRWSPATSTSWPRGSSARTRRRASSPRTMSSARHLRLGLGRGRPPPIRPAHLRLRRRHHPASRARRRPGLVLGGSVFISTVDAALAKMAADNAAQPGSGEQFFLEYRVASAQGGKLSFAVRGNLGVYSLVVDVTGPHTPASTWVRSARPATPSTPTTRWPARSGSTSPRTTSTSRQPRLRPGGDHQAKLQGLPTRPPRLAALTVDPHLDQQFVNVGFEVVTTDNKRIAVSKAPASVLAGSTFQAMVDLNMSTMLAQEGVRSARRTPWQTPFYYDNPNGGGVVQVIAQGTAGLFSVAYAIESPRHTLKDVPFVPYQPVAFTPPDPNETASCEKLGDPTIVLAPKGTLDMTFSASSVVLMSPNLKGRSRARSSAASTTPTMST